MAIEAKNQPNATGLAYTRQQPDVELVRDVYGGTRALRKKHTKYLPKFPMETTKGYEARSDAAVLFNALKRTVGGLTGMILRRPPKLGDDVPGDIVEHCENIDLQGRALPMFVSDLSDNGMLDGHSHIFVDMPSVPPGVIQTLQDERDAQLRPYWVNLLKMQVLRFKTMVENGRAVLVEFAYCENAVEPDGEYGEKAVERVRRYQLVDVAELGGQTHRKVVCTIWKKTVTQAGEEWVPDGPPTYMTISRIPLVTFYTHRTAFMESVPLLLDLAFENVRHYQLRSDRDNTMHICGLPIPVFSGMDEADGKLAVGSDMGIRITDPNGKAAYLEPTGAALDATRTELQDIEARMATLGLAMLQRETRAAETAESKRIDKGESDSRLARIAMNLENALEEALSFHAEWLDLGEDAGGSVEVNMDFENQALDPAMLKELRGMVATGDLSIETLWDLLVAGETLPDTFDPKKEHQRIADRISTMPDITPMPVEPKTTTISAPATDPAIAA